MGVHLLRRPQNSWRLASGRGEWGRNRSALARDSQHGVSWGGGEGGLLSYLVYVVVTSLGTVYLCLSLICYTCDQVGAVSSLTRVTSCMSGVPPPGERGRGERAPPGVGAARFLFVSGFTDSQDTLGAGRQFLTGQC